jgi:hypothetical protein
MAYKLIWSPVARDDLHDIVVQDLIHYTTIFYDFCIDLRGKRVPGKSRESIACQFAKP